MNVPNPYLLALAAKRRPGAMAGLPPLTPPTAHRTANGGLEGLKEVEYAGVAPDDLTGAMPPFPSAGAMLPPLQVPGVPEPSLHINQPIDVSGQPRAFQPTPYEAPARDRRGMEKTLLIAAGLGLLGGGAGGALAATTGAMQGYGQGERESEALAFKRWQQNQERGREASIDEMRRWEAGVRAQESARAGDRAYNDEQIGLYRARLQDRDTQIRATMGERDAERDAMSDAARSFDTWRENEAKRKAAREEFEALLPVKQINAKATMSNAEATLKRADAYRDSVADQARYRQGQLGVAKDRASTARYQAETGRMGAVTQREALRWKRVQDRVNAGRGSSRKDVEETIGKLLADAADMEKAIPRARKEMVMDPKTRTMRETEGTEWVKPPADATKAAAQLRANAEGLARKYGLKIVERRDGTRFTVPLAGRR